MASSYADILPYLFFPRKPPGGMKLPKARTFSPFPRSLRLQNNAVNVMGNVGCARNRRVKARHGKNVP